MKLALWAWLLLDALAVARLTRLVTTDTVGERFRRWVLGDIETSPPWRVGLFYFLVCPWCVSVWAAAGVVLLTRFAAGWWAYVSAALAFSYVAGLLARIDR